MAFVVVYWLLLCLSLRWEEGEGHKGPQPSKSPNAPKWANKRGYDVFDFSSMTKCR